MRNASPTGSELIAKLSAPQDRKKSPLAPRRSGEGTPKLAPLAPLSPRLGPLEQGQTFPAEQVGYFLWVACRQNEEEEARRLLGVKFEGAAYKPTAVLSFRGLGGKTPLHAAAFANAAAIARALLDAGANVDSLDGYGNTSLLTAAQEGHLEVVKVLLERGAVPGKSNAFGDDAAAVARRNGHLECEALVAEAAAVASPDSFAAPRSPLARGFASGANKLAFNGNSSGEWGRAAGTPAAPPLALAPALVQTAAAPPPAGGVLAAATAFTSPTPADGVIHVTARQSSGASAGSAARGMKQRVDAIKEALSVEAGLPLPAAIKAANELMGIDGAGPLPEQVRRLVEELGLEY